MSASEPAMAHPENAVVLAACNDCAEACDRCVAAGLQDDSVRAITRCIALAMDCAQVCRLAASCIARGSVMTAPVSGLCAELCERCAEECARHPKDHCRRCAAACRRCAEACRALADAAPAAAVRHAVPA